MDKVKFNFDVCVPAECMMIDAPGEQKIAVYNRISYTDKEQYAKELVERTQVTDEDTGKCFSSSLYQLVDTLLFVKYYTNIDTSDSEEDLNNMQRLYDFVLSIGLRNKNVEEFVENDIREVRMMEWKYEQSIRVLFEGGHSLEQTIKRYLTFDVDNKETRELIEKLIDAKGALMEKESREQHLTNKQRVKDAGGAVINFAKRAKN